MQLLTSFAEQADLSLSCSHITLKEGFLMTHVVKEDAEEEHQSEITIQILKIRTPE